MALNNIKTELIIPTSASVSSIAEATIEAAGNHHHTTKEYIDFTPRHSQRSLLRKLLTLNFSFYSIKFSMFWL